MKPPKRSVPSLIIRAPKDIEALLEWAKDGASVGLPYQRGVLQAIRWLTGRTPTRPDSRDIIPSQSVERGEADRDEDPDEDDFM